MNGKPIASGCEYFEMLVSCRLDGELTVEEQSELEEHLGCCSLCRQRSECFEEVNNLVVCLGDAEELPAAKVVVPLGMDRECWDSNPITEPRTVVSGLTPYAVLVGIAATLLIWLGIVLPTSRYAGAKEMVAPIVTLAQINSTREEDQIFKESLELEVRTLLLEIELLNDDESTQQVKEQYEQILRRIKEI